MNTGKRPIKIREVSAVDVTRDQVHNSRTLWRGGTSDCTTRAAQKSARGNGHDSIRYRTPEDVVLFCHGRQCLALFRPRELHGLVQAGEPFVFKRRPNRSGDRMRTLHGRPLELDVEFSVDAVLYALERIYAIREKLIEDGHYHKGHDESYLDD